MRFLLRCIFFLSIVYGAILRDDGRLPDISTMAARAWPGTQVERRIPSGVGELCRHDPSACVTVATTFGRLLAVGPEGGRRSPARDRGAIGAPAP